MTPRLRPRFTLALVLAALALVTGCQPKIGDACNTSTDCSTQGDRLCDTTQPGGYCTIFNCEPNTCPEDDFIFDHGVGANANLARIKNDILSDHGGRVDTCSEGLRLHAIFFDHRFKTPGGCLHANAGHSRWELGQTRWNQNHRSSGRLKFIGIACILEISEIPSHGLTKAREAGDCHFRFTGKELPTHKFHQLLQR